VNALVNKSM